MVKIFLQTSQAALLVNVTPTFEVSGRLEGWAISCKGYHAGFTSSGHRGHRGRHVVQEIKCRAEDGTIDQ